MAKPFVTALIDTYNHERFIEEAIRSVLEQDFPASELEIIVVDDGSVDSTPEVVRRFSPRVRLLRKRNGGQASAFNAGIAEARGELLAFLDGDDWWVPKKLSAVTEVFSREPSVGLVGHGLTQVYLNGSQRTEVIREASLFRITSIEIAKKFRMCRGFLGTSRMTYRRRVLEQIGQVPESLLFEADEYLFTLGSVLTDVLILRDALTNYRLHDTNLFQFANGTSENIRKKQRVLVALAGALSDELARRDVPKDVARTIVECVEVESEVLRLVLDGGFPWETVLTESKIMRIFHSDASLAQHLFSYVRLLPAFVMPAASYYRWRSKVSNSGLYTRFRRKFFPFPLPRHVERREKPGSGANG